jgi:hypothetical protein
MNEPIRRNEMTTTATAQTTKTSFAAKIRRMIRELRGGNDAMFRYDREFRA